MSKPYLAAASKPRFRQRNYSSTPRYARAMDRANQIAKHVSADRRPGPVQLRRNTAMLLNSIDAAYAWQSASPERIVASTRDIATPSVAQLGSRIRGGLPPRTLRRVREYIEAHLERTISIRALAAIAGLSMYHFARAFKQS